ncbi:group-specific protein [Bacillus wiedmannii]|uniref:Group-specific protein n=2 Tax=Bacillus cereus group TaxID=86661 RepID=A0A1C4E6P8_BACCE|nr:MULTISPECIES: group-specific protein [Bacillus cereus group]MBZ4223747.1 group-specific protein [Bacillus wiedmannii]MCC2459220.1 group-specific protein [Bacillus mobilis]MCU5434585.1 group-specific protein [Bacillus mobilis]MCU5593367.1 group-specific protein [Bacillus mobilis]MCU5736671.1 group-specific protein [Bacillus mobilis]
MACNIDHSMEDVMNKLESQKSFLPEVIFKELKVFLRGNHSQEILNDIFHLLKKYDLVSEEEREMRNTQLLLIIK